MAIEVDTLIIRINMAEATQLDKKIKTQCDNFGKDGYRLAATFAFEHQLVLIFQKASA